jgi:hypothetical protein
MICDVEATAAGVARDGCCVALGLIVSLDEEEGASTTEPVVWASVGSRRALADQSPVELVVRVLDPIAEASIECTGAVQCQPPSYSLVLAAGYTTFYVLHIRNVQAGLMKEGSLHTIETPRHQSIDGFEMWVLL